MSGPEEPSSAPTGDRSLDTEPGTSSVLASDAAWAGLLGGTLGAALWVGMSALAGRVPPGTMALALGLALAPGAALGAAAGLYRHAVGRPTPGNGGGAGAAGRRLVGVASLLLVGGPLAAVLFGVTAQSPARVGLALGLLLALLVSLGWLLPRGALGRLGLLRAGEEANPSGAKGSVWSAAAPWLGLLLLTLALVAIGSPSGVGHPWALFGVFKRPELDLAGPLGAGLAALGGFLASARLASSTRVARGGASAALVLALGLAWQARSATPESALALEAARGPLATLLALGQRLSDGDRDGVSQHFGGGDCDDKNPLVFPGAAETPNNGRDEDCDGADLELAAAPASDAPESQPSKTPSRPLNVLLLTIDTTRFDWGATEAVPAERIAPHLLELRKRSTSFERAYSLASYTSKSLGPALIGRYPSETERSFEHFDRFSPKNRFVFETAQQGHVSTLSVQGYWYFFFKGYGLERGFDVIDSSAAPKNVAIEGDQSSNAGEVADAAIARLSELAQAQKQFLAWVHWVDPHSAYVRHAAHDFGSSERERYQSEVAKVDFEIGRILAHLEQVGLADSTAILVTSDHGEAFGEHGMIRHGFEVWEELVRVPLLLHVPGAGPQVVQARRSAIDLVPTVLDLLGLTQPAEAAPLRGVSWLLDVNSKDGHHAERPVFVDMPEGPHNQERRAFYDGPHKLITSRGRPLGLYNLEQDPAERNDLKGDAELLASMKERQAAFLSRLSPVKAR